MKMPSIDEWVKEAKSSYKAENAGMYLIHNGVVRATAKAKVRFDEDNTAPVIGMILEVNRFEIEKAINNALNMDGITFVKVWINEREVKVGDDIMLVIVAGDIRPNVLSCFNTLVERIKKEGIKETELF